MAAYDQAQFEQAFQLVTAISHQIVKVDFDEMTIWIEKILGPKAVNDEQRRKNLDNLRNVMSQFKEMQKTLFENGIPVRNIENYQEAMDRRSPGQSQG